MCRNVVTLDIDVVAQKKTQEMGVKARLKIRIPWEKKVVCARVLGAEKSKSGKEVFPRAGSREGSATRGLAELGSWEMQPWWRLGVLWCLKKKSR